LVERHVRDVEAVGSNPTSPILNARLCPFAETQEATSGKPGAPGTETLRAHQSRLTSHFSQRSIKRRPVSVVDLASETNKSDAFG
jgi:hypothetical protein